MIDESLPVLWTSDEPISQETVTTGVQQAIEQGRASRERERSIRAASLAAVALLCPLLAWAAANGVTPLVRLGYVLMAAGATIVLTAEWMYLAWSRDALPGPIDARAQLQRTAFLLVRQAHLLRTAAIWCSPVFVGVAFIGGWVFQERSRAEGYLLWAIAGAAWFATGFAARSGGAKKLDARRQYLERLLSDL